MAEENDHAPAMPVIRKTMTIEKKIIERRKYKRYKAKDGAFAAISPLFSEKLGQIIDISMGGLAFKYITGNDNKDGEKKKEYEHSILLSSLDCYVEEIPFKTVEDREITNYPSFSSMKLRERRVKFNSLSSRQIFDLNSYLENNVIEKFDAFQLP